MAVFELFSPFSSFVMLQGGMHRSLVNQVSTRGHWGSSCRMLSRQCCGKQLHIHLSVSLARYLWDGSTEDVLLGQRADLYAFC